MDSRTSHYLTRVRHKLNWLVFLEHCGTRALLIPLLVAAPTVVFHLWLRRPFPVTPALAAGAVALLAWAVWRTWQRRYAPAEVRAFVDSWVGGKGNVLMDRDAAVDGPVPGTRWRWTATRGAITACATLFVCHVPVLESILPPPLVTHSTRRLEEKLEELEKLALVTEPKKEELAAALQQFQEATQKMSTEEFWHANDKFAEKLDQALAESQSTFEQAADALQSPTVGGPADMNALAKALPQLLKNLAEISPELAKKIAALAAQAKAGNLEELAQALKAMSPEELRQLARQLEQQAAQCQNQRPGKDGNGAEPGGLAAALEKQLAEQGFQEGTGAACGTCAGCLSGGQCTNPAAGSGSGGVSRGPGTNNRLFGNESPELQAAMNNALLPATGAKDPGEALQKTEIPAAPKTGTEHWGQPVQSGAATIGTEATSTESPAVAPRYRPAVGRYFSK